MSNSVNMRFHRKRLKALSRIKNWKRDEKAHINDCWTPSLGASKADLAEYHAEEMKLRRRRQLGRTSNVLIARPTKNDEPDYRKSIWPASKIARRTA